MDEIKQIFDLYKKSIQWKKLLLKDDHLVNFIKNHPDNNSPIFKNAGIDILITNVLKKFNITSNESNHDLLIFKLNYDLSRINSTVDKIKFIIKENPQQFSSIIKNNFKELTDFILSQTSWLKENVLFKTRIYCAINSIISFPKCLECKNEIKNHEITSIDEGFVKFCSESCAVKSKITQSKINKTCLQKYGSKTFLGSKIGQQSRKNYFQKNFGVDWFSQTPDWKENVSNTCMKRYGVENKNVKI